MSSSLKKYLFLILLYLICNPAKLLPFNDNNELIQFVNLDTIPEEELIYDLSFLWFKKAATGKIFFKKVKDDEFIATLDAETKGFIGWLTYRHYKYISHIKIISKDNIRSMSFEKVIIKGKKERKSISQLDYKMQELRWSSYKDGKLYDKKKESIPDNIVYEDVLSTFYKFRLGLFGKIFNGKKISVYTIPEKGIKQINIRIANEKEEKEEREILKNDKKGTENYKYLVFVTVPRILFGSKTGLVKIWFNENLIPLTGTVKDAIGLGDVTGTLVGRKIWRRNG